MPTLNHERADWNPAAECMQNESIRYANCWEDADVLVAALQPMPGQRVLSIASAGDNVLALLAEGVEVVAADMNRAQLACLELRCVAFRRLDYERLLAFLGVTDTDDRPATYRKLESDLSATSRRFWTSHPQHLANGIIHAGKFENYFRIFRKRLLPLIHSPDRVSRLLDPKDRDERVTFWNDCWNNRRWRLLCRLFFGRFAMSRFGRAPETFRYVEGNVSAPIMRRVRLGLTELPTDNNPFLHYIATGNFGSTLPRYLRPDCYEAIRSGIDRLTYYHGPVEQAGRQHVGQGFDAFNLSDIFEYIDRESATALYGKLLDVARPGARLAYWNMLVPRHNAANFVSRVEPLTEFSAELFAGDKAFFYRDFLVDEVRTPLAD